MKRMKKIISLVMMLCLLLVMSMNVFAASDASPEVAKAREGVLQVRLVYRDPDNGHIIAGQTGSGFLIGLADDARTIITNYHVVHFSDADMQKFFEETGIDLSNPDDFDVAIEIVVKRDVVIQADYINGSERTDFAILEMEQAIYDRAPLKIANSDDLVETQNIYALGFPAASSAFQDEQIFTTADVTVTNGIVGKFQGMDEIDYILHNATISSGNSGGPLVNSSGYVVGLNTAMTIDRAEAVNYSHSVSINEVSSVLDALGIEYIEAGTVVVEEPEVLVNPPVTEEPAVEEPATEEPATEEPVKVDVPAVAEVEEPEGPNMVLIGGIAAAVVVVIVIVVVVVMSGKKKKVQPQMNPNIPPVSPVTMQTPPPVAPAAPIPPAYNQGMPPMNSGAGETSVLGAGAGETSVLGGGTQPAATLIRKKNRETVRIVKPRFTVGKERQKVDFCVPDNNSVSRTHIVISYRDGAYYVADQNSTNFTFVNGNKIPANQDVKLNPGDKIRLADEEFDFTM